MYAFAQEQKFEHVKCVFSPVPLTGVQRTIVDPEQIQCLTQQVRCPLCHLLGTLRLWQASVKYMIVIGLFLFDEDCQQPVTDTVFTSIEDSSATNKSGEKPFMVNKAATLASLLVGMGPYKFNSFCQHLDMPGFALKSFNKHASCFYNKNEALVDHFSHRGRISSLLTWNALTKPGVLFFTVQMSSRRR